MSNSFSSGDTQITFNNKNLFDGCTWSVLTGSFGLSGSSIVLDPNSSCRCILTPDLSSALMYMRVSCDMDSSSKEPYTDTTKKASVNLRISTDSDNKPILINNYFPKFIYEDTYKNRIVDNNSIFSIDNSKVTRIVATLYNNYDKAITFNNLTLNYGAISASTEDVLEDIAQNIDFQNQIAGFVSDALINNTMQLVIPLVDSLPDLDSVPDGYICRVNIS